MKGFGISLALLLGAWVQVGHAQDACDHCNKCGGASCVEKTCRLVCTKKTITTYCYGVKCEDFCVPGRSTEGCEHCEIAPGCPCSHKDCNSCDTCDKLPECIFHWKDWCPAPCGEVRTRKILTKYVATKEIPWFKWEVELHCSHCGCSTCGFVGEGGATPAAAGAAPAHIDAGAIQPNDAPVPPTPVGAHVTAQ